MNVLKQTQHRISLLIISIALFFALILYLIETRRQSEINLIFKEKRTELSTQVDTTFSLLNKVYSNSVYDYTYWDDLIKFVNNPNLEWAYVNLESSFTTIGADYMWIYDKKMDYVYSFSRAGLNNIKRLPISKDSLKLLFSKKWFKHFFFADQNDFVEVFTGPIQPSDDYKREVPPNGFLIAGKRWDKKYINSIEHLLSIKIDLIPLKHVSDFNTKLSRDHDNIYISKIFYGWNDRPLVFFYGQAKSELLTSIVSSIRYRIPLIIFLGGIFVFIIYFALFQWVIKPIRYLSKGLEKEDYESLKQVEKLENEFSSFAKLIKEFFVQKDSLELEIQKGKEAEKELTKIRDELEDNVIARTSELASVIELRQRERDQAQMYLDTAATMITLLDDFGNIRMINKRGLSLLGYKEEELIGKNWFNKCVSNSDRSNVWDNFIKSINAIQAPVENSIYNVFSKDGRELIMIFQHTFISDGGPTFKGLLFSATDITDLKKIERELVAAKEKAEEASRMKTAFFTNMSHELRTPLMGILGNSEMLMEYNISERVNTLTAAIFKSGRRLLDTVNMVLDLARFESGKEKLYFKLVDVVQVVEEITDYFKIVANKKGLDFRTSIPTEHFHAMIDERLFREILNNLVSNAVKFTINGEIKIDIRKDEFNLLFRINDSGVGIPAEYLGVIFEEFRQVSEGHGRGFEGTGLGLAITNKYVEALGGKIKVKSEVNVGSEFYVVIPLNHIEQKASFYYEPSEILKESVVYPVEKQNTKKTILVIDDDEISREILYHYLEEYYNIDSVKSAEEALVQIEKKSYAALLIDINLGRGMNGVGLVKRIRENKNYASIPMIAETAFALEGDEREFLMAGFDLYISKPFTRIEILNILDEGFKKEKDK